MQRDKIDKQLNYINKYDFLNILEILVAGQLFLRGVTVTQGKFDLMTSEFVMSGLVWFNMCRILFLISLYSDNCLSLYRLISAQLSRLPSGASPLLSTVTVFLWDYQPLHFLYYPLTHPYILLHTLTHTSPPSRPAATCAPQWRTEWFGK